ncbi:MAG: spore coat protein [Treponema sp.]|nr:spore coat protein [Treponema sp.]
MTAITLQARIDSSRLPGKALFPLADKPIIFRVMEALNNVSADLRILACSEDSYSTFLPIAEEAGFRIFAGPKDDVLERYCQVIKKFSISRVIRATGDNPFVFADAAAAINSDANAINADYAGYIDLPYGAGVESVSAAALLLASAETNDSFDREHVCPYLYNHPELFKLHCPLAPILWHYPDIRLTVDTQEDYDKAIELYNSLKKEPFRHQGSVIIKTYNKLFPDTSVMKIENPEVNN